jgi:EmrB/QacA subfamily drug resistance transporter
MSNKQSTALTLFAIGVFMGGLDNGIMTSALTTLIASFKVSASWGSWIITIYTLGLAVSIPIMAKLSDRYGRKKLFLIGVALFGLGSLSVALSHSFTMLLLSRILQSLGGGGIFPIANGYITATIPTERQGRALGMIGGMNGIAAILGPNIGSFILGVTHNWHWLFWINVPISLVLVVLGTRYISENVSENTGKLDLGGIILLSLGMLSIMYSFTNLKSGNFAASLMEPWFYGFFVTGLVLIGILLVVERGLSRRGGDPLIPMLLLKQPELRWTLGIGLVSGLILASVIFLPAFIQLILGWPSSQAGYWYTPMAIASGVGAMGGGAFMDKRGPVTTLVWGMIAAAIGAALFPLWVTHTWQMVIASSLIGLGVGITLGAPVNFLITVRVPDNKSTALGILSLTRQIGMTLGPTVFAGFITRAMTQFPTALIKNLANIGISVKQIPASELVRMKAIKSLGDVAGQVQLIPSESIRQTVMNTLQSVAKVGFNQLYWTTLVIALIGLGAVLILSKYYRPSRDTSMQSHM